MASKMNISGLTLPGSEVKEQPISDLRFDWIMALVSIWWLGGLFVDGWAHSNLPQLETFFTPWHAVIYSGYLAVATTLVIKTIRSRKLAVAGDRANGGNTRERASVRLRGVSDALFR